MIIDHIDHIDNIYFKRLLKIKKNDKNWYDKW